MLGCELSLAPSGLRQAPRGAKEVHLEEPPGTWPGFWHVSRSRFSRGLRDCCVPGETVSQRRRRGAASAPARLPGGAEGRGFPALRRAGQGAGCRAAGPADVM